MKNIKIYIAGAALMALAGACSEEQFDMQGEGSVKLAATLNSDMEVVSRATDAELAESCEIWISSTKGLVRKYKGLDNVPTEPIALVTGHYVAQAWAGDSVSASFDKRAFKGVQEFDVEAGQTAQVQLVCKIANVAVKVDYSEAEGLEDVLPDFSMTVGHARGSLIFDGRDERTGYFMMPSTDKNIAYELKGTQVNGTDFSFPGVIENARPGTLYNLKVKYSAKPSEVGGAIFIIEIDETAIEVKQEIELIAAPKIEGKGFDIANPVMGEPGSVGRQSVYVISATGLKNIELTSDWFLAIPELRGNDVDLLNMSELGASALEAAGLNFNADKSPADTAEGTIYQINFEESLTNALSQGDHSFEIKATDVKGKSSVATLRFSVSDAPVQTLDPEAATVGAHTAVLRGTVAKDGVENIGFNYRAVGASEWQHVDGVASSRAFDAGTVFTASLTGLKGNTAYEYVATADDFVSAVVAGFTTENDQLPNASFEQWVKSGKVLLPSADAGNMWWDSGNHGSATMNKNITENSTAYVHSGSYSAMLKSQFVGVDMGFTKMGKFAAGNIFAGNYLYTDGTDGELGWGRPWTLRPTKVRLWARYEPGTVQSGKDAGSGDHLAVGDLDQGIVYCALMDSHTEHYTQSKSDYNNTDWPSIIKTKSANRQLFDRNGEHVVAYGEYIFETATDGNGLVQIEFDLNDVNGNLDVANIIFVASASRYGDYFEGGEGSTLYIDDIELVY
ncbi:MAG: DUF4493 domain-containing protein [Muribaculaceae bacterium]|nr:DUF4493 domain-containing protein [Muribaculaceae bacterium]